MEKLSQALEKIKMHGVTARIAMAQALRRKRAREFEKLTVKQVAAMCQLTLYAEQMDRRGYDHPEDITRLTWKIRYDSLANPIADWWLVTKTKTNEDILKRQAELEFAKG